MASFGLDLDGPLLPNVDAYISPTKDDDVHRIALNAVVVNIHRSESGAFERLVSKDLGDYLSNADAKVRERATQLLAELLARLPKLPLSSSSAARFAEFFASRLADYPSVVPALEALSSLLKNHAPALLEAQEAATSPNPPASADSSGTAAVGQDLPRHGSAEVIARGVFEELHVPALSQSIRQAALSVLRALVAERGLRKALSSVMGAAFVLGLVRCLEGEKDPRCLIVGLSALRLTQEGFDPAVLEETSEAVFDATACYFPVTFTPPPNDPHKISPDALKTGLEDVLVGSPGMARHVLPMLLDKLSSEVSTAKEAALKGLVAAVRKFAPPRVGAHLRAVGNAMFQEAVNGADPDLAALALESLTEVVRETASHAEVTGLGEACHEWRVLAVPLIEGAAIEVAGDQPCSVLGRGSARVLQALAASSALGLRFALEAAVPRLVKARSDATSALKAMESAPEVNGAKAGAARTATGAADDAQAARLAALAGLAAAIDREVDFSGRKDGAPLGAFVEPLLVEFSAALATLDSSVVLEVKDEAKIGAGTETDGGGRRSGPAPTSTATLCIAARGLSDLVTRPPVPLLGEDQVARVVALLSTALAVPDAWGDSGGGGVEYEGRRMPVPSAVEGTAAFAFVAALRLIGLRRTEYATIVLETAIPPLLENLPHVCRSHLASFSSSTSITVVASSERGAVTTLRMGRREGDAERALSALVELSEIPGVFTIAASAMLAEAIMSVDDDRGSGGGKRVLRGTRVSGLALVALDDALKRAAVKRGSNPELLAFIRGAAPDPPSSHPHPSRATPPGRSFPAFTATTPMNYSSASSSEGKSDAPRGLALLLAALEASPPSSEVCCDRQSWQPHVSASQGYYLAAAVSAVRSCARAAPVEDQDALLSSLLSSLVPRPREGRGDDTIEAEGKEVPMMSALAAVVGAVRLDSRALGEGGIAAVAIPALLKGALAEGATGLEIDGASYSASFGGRGGGDVGSGEASRSPWVMEMAMTPCCQCLAAVLNKLAPGSELDESVALVTRALTGAFETGVAPGDEGGVTVETSELMDVDEEGDECGVQEEGAWPLQCLSWTTKAIAMRGGLEKACSTLLELLCGLVLEDADGDRRDPSVSRAGRKGCALAAAAAYGVVLGGVGVALKTSGEGGGVRISPVWRQKFFVQNFPKLLAAARGPASEETLVTRNPRTADADAQFSNAASKDAQLTPKMTCEKIGGNGRVPALLALLHIIRGVPPEALLQDLDDVVASVVLALGSEYPPLQMAALETFQILSRDYLVAFGEHLSSLIPLLLSMAEGEGVIRGAESGGPENKFGREATPSSAQRSRGVGALSRFRAVQCLTTLAALPYPRLHPFKTLVTRRLRGPLDDDRRAVRQAAAKSRNVWFLLG